MIWKQLLLSHRILRVSLKKRELSARYKNQRNKAMKAKAKGHSTSARNSTIFRSASQSISQTSPSIYISLIHDTWVLSTLLSHSSLTFISSWIWTMRRGIRCEEYCSSWRMSLLLICRKRRELLLLLDERLPMSTLWPSLLPPPRTMAPMSPSH